MSCWLFNTDESELAGHDADVRMLARSCIAAWGTGYAADALLNKPEAGDQVLFYRNGVGIIAKAIFDHTEPFSSNDIFNKQKEGEFSRKVLDLRKPNKGAVSCAMVKTATGYSLPTVGKALKMLQRDDAIQYIESQFPIH